MPVTIYSQHPSRGKVQILATYRSPSGVASATVTSVARPDLATPIVDALNRVSACATVPVSVSDHRGDRVRPYPSGHLAALVDHRARADLLHSTHSLWYGHAKLLLHQALTDLDVAAAAVPPPVRTAIIDELIIEEHDVRQALVEYTEGIEPPLRPDRRRWEFNNPFVIDLTGLSADDRDTMNRLERDATTDQIAKAVADMHLLHDAHRRAATTSVTFLDPFTITADELPGSDRHYLTILAPNGKHEEWIIEIGQWDIDLDAPGNESETALGDPILLCTRTSGPAATELVHLLTQTAHLPTWATTPVGHALTGTTFVVTSRFTDVPEEPDFAALFRPCQGGRPDPQLTPRIGKALYAAAGRLAAQAHADITARGDTPVGNLDHWELFDAYPRTTWRENTTWRRRAARAFDDLRNALATGEWPHPRCPAEEMAAHLMLRLARRDDEREDDRTWDLLQNLLPQDVATYRPEEWFIPFPAKR